ncbi:MAG: alpha/beta fold hydrolase [Planctomycetota bacterium]
MTVPPSKRHALVVSHQIDRLCDEFEERKGVGAPVSIEEFLDRFDPEHQSELFTQLLAIELEECGTESIWPLKSDFLNRFPKFEVELEAVFEELQLLDWTDATIGRFTIVKEIGRGGMGVVFLAKDPSLDRDVAIKLLTRDRRSDGRWLRRFRQEARLASGLNHPNILTIFEIGEDQQTPYIASEFVQGITLKTRINQGLLTLGEILDCALQVANGMAAAHRAGIIHRDLKADNVMIRADGLIKILDFGLAKYGSHLECGNELQSKTGAITGTAHYMSPEQARGQRLTSATDVFSFGILLYQMITGRLPFKGPTISDAIAQILNSDPEPFAGEPINLPASLEELVFSCLRKTHEQRPRFEQLVKDFELQLRESRELEFELQTPCMGAGEIESEPTSRYDVTQVDWFSEALSPGGIRYAQSGDINIAWQTIGKGPVDIVFVMGWVSHLEWFWKEPSFATFLKKLATFARVILFDKRGTGLSDRVAVDQLPDLETRMDDVRAVMEAAKSEHAVLCGVSEGGPLCALFAASYPEKTLALVMLGSYARRLWAEDYPWGPTEEQRQNFLDLIGRTWGGPVGIEDRAPSVATDPHFREWWARYLRMGASPGAAKALTTMNAKIDVRAVLPSIRVPSLVIHRTHDRCLLVEEGKYLAEKIPGAKFVELPGDDHLPFVGDADRILHEIERFLNSLSGGGEVDCVLATVLCVQFENATAESLESFVPRAKREVVMYRGQNFVQTNHGLLATFDGPVRSLMCALAISQLAQTQELAVRCGLETGTCNLGKSKIEGPAVSGAQELLSHTPVSKVWLSSSLRNLISGGGLRFEMVNAENAWFELVSSS